MQCYKGGRPKCRGDLGYNFLNEPLVRFFKGIKVWSLLMSAREYAYEAKNGRCEPHSCTHAFAREIYEKIRLENPEIDVHE